MKKIIAIALLLCLCVGMIIPAQAAATMTVSAETVSVAPGEKFALNISVDNNPGFAYLKIQLKYDTASFEFHSSEAASTSDALILAAGESLISWDAGVNYSDNGTIGTLYFTAFDSTEVGEYTIEIDVVECYNINTDNVQTASADSKVTVRIPQAISTITSADMVLGTDFTLNYYAELDPSHTAAQMKFTMNGAETTVSGTPTGNGNEYCFAFSKIPPQCMGDNVKAELVLDGTVLDTKDEYSVRQYCVNTLSKSADELSVSAEKHAALKTLIADMLEYGAKAQLYRGYKTNALVNDGVTGQSTYEQLSAEVGKYADESGSDAIEMTAAGVYFDYANSLYVKFTVTDLTEEDFYILAYNETTDEETEYTLSDCTLVSESTSTYALILDPLLATQYDDLYFIDLYAKDARGRFRLQQSLEYSVAAYVYAMQNKADGNGDLTKMAELARTTYTYGLSASAYAAIDN